MDNIVCNNTFLKLQRWSKNIGQSGLLPNHS